MNNRWFLIAFFCTVTWISAENGISAEDAKFAAEQIDFFEMKIRPVFVTHCYECHSQKSEEVEGELYLDNRASLLKGGASGPAIIPGNPEKSILMQALRYGKDSFQMPPDEKLSDAIIADFEKWIKTGAADPRDGTAIVVKSNDDITEARKHWAFQVPKKPETPKVKHQSRVQNEIDAFVLKNLAAKGLSLSDTADTFTKIRRAHFALTGLPPTKQEIDAAANKPTHEAYQAVVDRLLASPHFGERWARHWLDVSRYADTKGYVFQEERAYKEAYKYRDWVVKSYNEDLPYDQFLKQQLVADQLPQDQQALEAMGFLTLGRRFLNNTHDIIDDRIDVVTRGLLGLTVTCARCHDHKYDPIKIDDYYSLYGVFASSDEPKNEPSMLRLVDKKNPFEPKVFIRGNDRNRGKRVPRQFLPILAKTDPPQPFKKGSGRFELAEAIADSENPLTARVYVNRVWGHLFGKPLVGTPSDFGVRSELPIQAELLDYLAVTFMEEGWSTKKLIRKIVLSSTFQQRSDLREDAAKVDPENELLWKMNRLRIDFEIMRDSLLVVSGQLDPKIGGPAVELTKKPFPTRRSIYGHIDRQNLPGLFRTFDFASPDTHSPQRYETTVPQQTLFLLNSPFVIEQAQQLVKRDEIQQATNPQQRIQKLYEIVTSRTANSQELDWAMNFIQPHLSIPEKSIVAHWQYGFGEIDHDSKKVKSFQKLPHFTGTNWQGGEKLPDDKRGWVLLNASGGHPGNNHQHSAIRRWIAPQDGVINIRGKLKHPAPQGDGVKSFVISNRKGILNSWSAHHNETNTNLENVKVTQGDILDFVTECQAHPDHDSFEWTVSLQMPAAAGGKAFWNSAQEFEGKPRKQLNVWERFAQVLMISNEFHFVD